MKIKWLFFSVWILSIIIFLVGSLLAPSPYTTFYSNLFGILVIAGVISFLLMLVFMIISKKDPRSGTNAEKTQRVSNKAKKDTAYLQVSKSTLWSIGIIFLFLACGLLAGAVIARNNKEKKQQTITPTGIPTQYQEPSPTPIPTAIPTPKPKAYVDPDPIIDCKFTYLGTIRLRRSVCSKSTDCQIGDKWVYYDSVDKCKADQKASQPVQQTQQPTNQQVAPSSNKVPVFLTYGQYTMYCPSQNADAVKSIDATMKSKSQLWANQYNNCIDLKTSQDPCNQNCNAKLDEGVKYCVQTYGPGKKEYDPCQSKVSSDYQSCTSSCNSFSDYCQYVYSEEKSLTAQINNLCK